MELGAATDKSLSILGAGGRRQAADCRRLVAFAEGEAPVGCTAASGVARLREQSQGKRQREPHGMGTSTHSTGVKTQNWGTHGSQP